MSSDVRRVPLNFDWPLGEVWHGYVLPAHLREARCSDCVNGSTDAYAWVQRVAYVIAGLADDARQEARGRRMHPWLAPLDEISYGYGVGRPGTQFAEFADGIAPDAAPGSLGRDVHRVQAALIRAAGLPDDWGYCPTCKGHGTVERYDGQREEAEAWEPTDPPTGDGWQMWETTSEGSPSSPVFTTPEELADYCAANVSIFGDTMAPATQWLAIIRGEDFAHVEIAPGVIIL